MANQYVNKVVQSNGTTLMDISDTTAVASDVASGKYFYLATGEKVEGTASGGDEPVGPTETLLGQTPYTLLEDADIKLVGDGSYTYSVSAIDAEFADRKNVALNNTTLTDEGTYFELADTGASAWYASTANMYFDGLVADTSYTVTVDSLGDGTTCTGGYWVIRDATGDNTYGVINPLTGSNTLTFTATGTSINVFMASADSAYFESGIKVARWRNMTITHAESASGTDEALLGELKAGTQITSSPSVEVYAIIESSGTLRGKTCVCLGDSVTALMAPPNDYPSVLASNTGMTVINGGFEGCRMSDTHPTATYAAFSAVKLADAIATGTWTTQDANISGFESGSYAPAHLTALKAVNWSNVDYITVEFGGNDAGDQYVYIDNTQNPTDTTTYVGAARYVYNRIHTAYPNIKIMFFVPMYRYWISDGKDSDEMTFTLGGNTYHYYDWGDALIASPPASGVPVIDMYRTLGINATNRQTYLLTSDQIHPSVAGCALIAQKFQTELTNHFLPSGGSSATLITKTITANGTYNASSDSADGYSSITVNVTSSGGTTVTVTGTVEGNRSNVLQIPCDFEPDLIRIHGDLSADVATRGIVTLTIIKDMDIYYGYDSSKSESVNYFGAIQNITGYNESDTSSIHATYSNNTLSVDTVVNSGSYRWPSGITYTYKLIKFGQSAPSATTHTIHFAFTDNTSIDITAYYDSTFIDSAITATIPSTYNNKTVESASLDGVTWYELTNIPLNTELIDFSKCTANTSIDDGGEEYEQEWYYVSDFTSVDSSMTFTYVTGTWTYIGLYDRNKTFVRVIDVSSSGTVDQNNSNLSSGTLNGTNLPSNVAYVKLSSTGTNSNYMSLIRTA